jgi:high affinity sulfate transporter 1
MKGWEPVVRRALPGIELARTYRLSWLRHDLLAGLVLTALLVPQGMAYAELAGLPPVTGLYATMIPLLVYAAVGPSRILVYGPDSAVSPLVAAAIVPLAAGADERVALAGMLALIVGGLCIAGGLFRFGFITDLLSKPVRIGYLAGIAVTVIVSQLPKLFGYSVDAEGVVDQAQAFLENLDETSLTALAIGLGCIVVIVVCRMLVPALPGVFLAVLGATLAVRAFSLSDDVEVVGVLPSGLPSLAIPDVGAGDLGKLVGSAVVIAFVAFADTSVLSRSYAVRLRQEVDENRELTSLGLTNAAAGLFQGFPLSTSSSRTAVAEVVGSKTQLTGVVGAISIGVLLAFATGIVEDLPTTALAAVVITAVVGLIDVSAFKHLLRVRRSEFELAVISFLGVTVLGVLWGIGLAVVLSLLAFIRRAWRPHDAVLGRAFGVKGYHDLERYPDAAQIPGLVLYRFDAPLFFANADHFAARVRRLAEGDRPVSWIVLCAEPITDVDSTAADMLVELDRELAAAGIELAFAELKDPVKDRLEQYGLVEQFGRDRFYATIGVAVRSYVAHTGVEWVDWEELHAGRPT